MSGEAGSRPQDATPLWLAPLPLVLASGSATRRSMLETAGLPVEVHPASIDERAVEDRHRAAGAGPAEVASALAVAKALAVASAMPGRIVVGADQTLALADESLHKPTGREEAAAQLRRLSGREHALHAAAAVAIDGVSVFETVSTARLRMRALSDAMIARYLDAAGPAVLSSVGAYQWEGRGVHLFERVEGDHFTILGLPLLPLLAFLRQNGWVPA